MTSPKIEMTEPVRYALGVDEQTVATLAGGWRSIGRDISRAPSAQRAWVKLWLLNLALGVKTEQALIEAASADLRLALDVYTNEQSKKVAP